MNYFSESAAVLQDLAESPPNELDQLVQEIFHCWEQGGTVISFGNGGSATDSLHFTTELVARMKKKPIAKPAISLCGSPSNLTAIANDWSFDELFSRQVQALANAEDVLIGISTSGNSRNVLAGLKKGMERGANCFGLTGEGGGAMGHLDIPLIRVPSNQTAHIQEGHIACLHYICESIDTELNGA